MVEIFLRTLQLEPRFEGEWLTIDVDLNNGMDLSSIDVASVRLNEYLAAAATDIRGSAMRLRFARRELYDFLAPDGMLTLTGRLSDGIGIRAAVRLG